MTALSGVRISCDIVDRNSDFAFSPCCACCVACLKLWAKRWDKERDCKKKKAIYPMNMTTFNAVMKPKYSRLIKKRISSITAVLSSAYKEPLRLFRAAWKKT